MNYGSRITNMLGEIVSIKKNVDKKNYEEINEKLDKLRKAGHHYNIVYTMKLMVHLQLNCLVNLTYKN